MALLVDVLLVDCMVFVKTVELEVIIEAELVVVVFVAVEFAVVELVGVNGKEVELVMVEFKTVVLFNSSLLIGILIGFVELV